jgi:hypothetical protein
MATNVQLYEALKPHVGQEAAGMIAEIVPPARDLATKQDILELRGEMHALEARLAHKLLSYFIPLWVMMGSMALAIVGLVATRT